MTNVQIDNGAFYPQNPNEPIGYDLDPNDEIDD